MKTSKYPVNLTRNQNKLNRSYITNFLLVSAWKMATVNGGVRLTADHDVAMSQQKQTTAPDISNSIKQSLEVRWLVHITEVNTMCGIDSSAEDCLLASQKGFVPCRSFCACAH